jgi:hypothetical protein
LADPANDAVGAGDGVFEVNGGGAVPHLAAGERTDLFAAGAIHQIEMATANVAFLWLAADDSCMVTAQHFVVDGGGV